MPNKSRKIISNSLITLLLWLLAGAAVWLALDHFNPAASLNSEELKELSTNLRSLASTLSQIAATMAGFLLAAIAIVLSLFDRKLIRRMSESGHLHVLVLRLKTSLLLCLCLTAIGVGMIVVPRLGVEHLYFAAGACVAVALSVVDGIWKLGMVFFFLSPLPTETPIEEERILYKESIGH